MTDERFLEFYARSLGFVFLAAEIPYSNDKNKGLYLLADIQNPGVVYGRNFELGFSEVITILNRHKERAESADRGEVVKSRRNAKIA